MGSHAHPPLIRSPCVLLMGCWDGGGNRVHPPHVLQEATRMERGPMLTHPLSTHPMFSRRPLGWRGVPCSPIPHPPNPCSPGGTRGWRGVPCPPWELIHPPHVLLMGCWDGDGNCVHLIHVLQGAHQDGEGSHAHPPLIHPPRVLHVGCWDGDRLPHLRVPCSQGRTPGMGQGITPTPPKFSGWTLGWRGGPTSSTPPLQA